jgi:flagellar hook protein FlgE
MPTPIWSAVSGLDNHQTWMDTLGNDIANVNTTGYKDARFQFEDILSQSLRGAAPPVQNGIGGTNPEQVGLGTTTGSIDTDTTQGSLQQTNLPTDLAIAGQGYFILSDGTNTFFSRDGVFHVDAAGNIVSSANGLHLRGFGPNTSFNGVDNTKLVNLTIPQQVNPAANTTEIAMFGNLDSRATQPVSANIQVFDSLGQQHTITLTFTPQTANGNAHDYTVSAASPDLNGATINIDNTTLSFNELGQLTSQASITLSFSNANPWNISGTTTASNATQANVKLDMNDPTLNAGVGTLTSFATNTAVLSQQLPSNPAAAGNPSGFLKSFSISQDGTIRGQYTSGFTAVLGQVLLSTFTNPAGLQRIGQNDWNVTSDSGQANIVTPGSGASGNVVQGSLETSNVNLADALASVILAERGFQANSRMVTTSDEMLQDVVAMKR